ncbi:nitrate reductase molybdenum cofactor assembly chaperone [Lederbergia panacisoli]|uniref:nitrate reductase molybdenum cofactor assembly chaperone n=1 Tax=Lederbergia panacisoli TaxID=1255251 RepID=UPI00214B0FF0|nr:nitrate reductase molybdenum cofactor assembly chaperone [Lederbergia panacisoli]MCR2821846.1 nitrate reductase molybdenum cofactor assembly chaperone [Lederbergia panacisoli]
MIDLNQLHNHKPLFGFIAQVLSYPEKRTFHPNMLEGIVSPSSPSYEYILKFWELVHEYSLEKLEELYVQTFDFQKKSTLYMTFVKFEDSKERGQMLARLKVLYEMYGLEMPNGELSDYLPLICEFIYAADWLGDPRSEESFNILLAVLEDGTYHLLNALEEFQSPYAPLIKGLRETVKFCIVKEAP